jgi:transcriptional regulator with XRE-family HTH domain
MNGTELKRRREEAGLSQSELAREVGVAPQTVSEWERDNRGIPKRRLVRLEQALHPPTEEWDSGGVLVLSWH